MSRFILNLMCFQVDAVLAFVHCIDHKQFDDSNMVSS
jgi:hypothetical protein